MEPASDGRIVPPGLDEMTAANFEQPLRMLTRIFKISLWYGKPFAQLPVLSTIFILKTVASEQPGSFSLLPISCVQTRPNSSQLYRWTTF